MAIRELHLSCSKLNCLFNNLGLTISSSKSKVCVFKKGGFRSSIDFRINNSSLLIVNQVKYLGLWLDGSLRWGKHVNETIQKVSKYINLLKVLSGPGWGIHQKHLRQLYISVIRSRMDYASFLYDNCCRTNLLKLDRIQNQALRVIGGYIRSTPIHVMENDLCLPPLQVRRKFLAGKFWLRSRSVSNNTTVSIVQELESYSKSVYWTNKKLPLLISTFTELKSITIHSCSYLEMFSLDTWVSNIELRDVIFDSIPLIDRAKKTFNIHVLKRITTNHINQQYQNFYKIFTDGSKNNDKGGAAFLDPCLECSGKFRIDSNTSIMHIELIAIAEALSYINSIVFDKFVILTDSKSALQHLARCTSPVRGIPIAYHILESILKLKSHNKKVCLQWIPSHVQLKENDDVDLLANQAIADGIPVNQLPLYSDFIHLVKNQCSDVWQEYFDQRSREKGIWYRTIQPSIPRRPWIDTTLYKRNYLKSILRLRSGHIPSNKFAFLMKKVTSPNCEECGVIEDIQHLLVECVRNAAFRSTCFTENRAMDIGYVNSLLSDPSCENIVILIKLLELGLVKQ